MTPAGVALDARVLLARRWTQPSDDTEANIRARDELGRPCNPHSPKAVGWTLVGALLRATNSDDRTPQAVAVFEALRKQLGRNPSDWANEPGRTQREVLAAFDAVIAELGGANG